MTCNQFEETPFRQNQEVPNTKACKTISGLGSLIYSTNTFIADTSRKANENEYSSFVSSPTLLGVLIIIDVCYSLAPPNNGGQNDWPI